MPRQGGKAPPQDLMHSISADSLLQRVIAAAEQRQFSEHTLTAYRRTWLKLIAWAAAEGLAIETLPAERAGEFYEFAMRGRSASHHLQVKAALALLYKALAAANPFAECLAPKFQIEKTQMRYHTPSQLGQLLGELREDRRSYFGRLTYHLAMALFFTGCRFHEWATLTSDRLVREPGGSFSAARMRVKGGSFRELPLTGEMSGSLHEWATFLESVKGVRLRSGGVGEWSSPARPWCFQGGMADLSAIRRSTPGSSWRASAPAFYREEVRGELRAAAALNNVELITALLDCNRQLAPAGLQLRITNGVVSLLTTQVDSGGLAEYLREQTSASGSPDLTTATLEVLACIAFKQPISIFGSAPTVLQLDGEATVYPPPEALAVADLLSPNLPSAWSQDAEPRSTAATGAAAASIWSHRTPTTGPRSAS